ncbi:dTDP-4-dehydrorhamnose 3,5-epimerase [Pseudoduganella flava]|uniref:dTDP-4-dehydrorhamnose 3,5-epimerase n=1 Tax=Pseudoduganella flava TaxID=871742 RepID=A0A562PCB7_9BURK|nr:dTDP-4-dehydrorhamnose 3,5-epimerase [Pseudoduganella flava]
MDASVTSSTLPEGVLLTPLRQIAHPQGDIFHALRADAPGYAGFGEAYFTHIHPGLTKGWKRHNRMVMNLVVPDGHVRFHLYREADGRTVAVELGDAAERYARLTVPPGIWVAFSGLGERTSTVLNLASLGHDPTEADNVPLETWPLA